MYSIDVIAQACRKRRKPRSRSILHHQSNHYRRWLASNGVRISIENVPDWEPPEYHFFYKILGPKTVPKIGSRINLTLIPALLDIRQGQVYVAKKAGYLKLVARPNIIKPVHSLDGEKWYSIIATVASRPQQDLELHGPFIKRMQYIPGVDDRLCFVYSPSDQSGAIQSHSEGNYGKTVRNFTAPYYRFDNCIECRDEVHQIGYVLANGPRFATLDRLQQHPDKLAGQIFDYHIDKVVCAKNDSQLTNVTRQSFLLKVEILSINAEKGIMPNYCMAVGRVRGCSQPNLYPNEPEFIAKNDNESDTSLFSPGTYVYIDHYINPELPSESANPYSDRSEFGQICYIIGPKTPEFGSFPIRPFS